LHVGGARTALFNWLFARHHGGTFILRIDDTDEDRSTSESAKGILDALRWLGMYWDEGVEVGGPHAPYIQSKRYDIYRDYARKLLDSDNAYYCYCSRDELDAEREKAKREGRLFRYDGKCRNLSDAKRRRLESEGRKPTIRLKIPSGAVIVPDLILGDVKFKCKDIDDFIIVKSDNTPLYNFTTVIDDSLMEITHVIRAQEHLSNTPKQMLIYRALGLEHPHFAHVPMVLGSSKGEKLSKRHGAVGVSQYRDEGYLPEAMVNFLARLGWAYNGQEEIFAVDELIAKFDLSRVGKSGSVFDIKKLRWLNSEYILRSDIPERTEAVIPFLRKAGLLDGDISPKRRIWLEKMVEAVGDRLKTLSDIVDYTSYLFVDDFEYDADAVEKLFTRAYVPEMLKELKGTFEKMGHFSESSAEAAIRGFLDKTGLHGIKALLPIRVALTGKTVGPGLSEVMALLGKDKVVQRFDKTLHY